MKWDKTHDRFAWTRQETELMFEALKALKQYSDHGSFPEDFDWTRFILIYRLIESGLALKDYSDRMSVAAYRKTLKKFKTLQRLIAIQLDKRDTPRGQYLLRAIREFYPVLDFEAIDTEIDKIIVPIEEESPFDQEEEEEPEFPEFGEG